MQSDNDIDINKATPELKTKILNFIKNNHPEDDHLDYKQKWESTDSELLKDIFSFTNTIHNKDCYLVYGVTNKKHHIVDMRNSSYRRDQKNITDLMSNIHIAGDYIPPINVSTITLNNGKQIDVLTIKNNVNVPIYLAKRYNPGKDKGSPMNPGLIYSRVGSRDTGINEITNFNRVEDLWEKRFGIGLPIKYRYSRYLSNLNEWTFNTPDFPQLPHEYSYFSYSSDYKVRVNIVPTPYDYNNSLTNLLINSLFNNTSWVYLEFKYNNNRVILKSCDYIDGSYGLVYFPVRYLHLNGIKFQYYSCIKGTFDGGLNNMLLNTYIPDRAKIIKYKNIINKVIIRYNSKSEEKEFIHWFKNKFTLNVTYGLLNLLTRINLKKYIFKWYMDVNFNVNELQSYIRNMQKILFIKLITREYNYWINMKI